MSEAESFPRPLDEKRYLFEKVLDIREAISWIAFGNFAGSAVGPRPLFEFREGSSLIDQSLSEDHGRELLAFDLLWQRAELGDIRLFGRRAQLVGDEPDPRDRSWSEPEEEPESVPLAVVTSAIWTDDEGGGLEAGIVSYWTLTVHHEDLMRWFPHRGVNFSDKETAAIRERIDTAMQRPAPSSRSVASIEGKCRRWIAELTANGIVPRSRDDLFRQALSKFPDGLSRRGFDRCWDSAAPDEWKRAGRKPRQD